MNSARNLSREGNADCLHFIIKSGSTNFLCFTSCEKEDWIIHVTNGIDVWRLSVDQINLESHKELAEVASYEAYFSRFSHAFKIGDLSLAVQGHRVDLSVGTGSTALKYELYEGTAVERKVDLQRALFYFAETCGNLKRKLSAKEEELAALKKEKTGGSDKETLLSDFELKKHSRNPAKVGKQQGLSIVNPSSRKRKAAKGVEYD